MKKLETIFLLTLSINFISAQNIDSLYNTFVNALETTTKENLILQGAAQNQKCGLPLIQYLKNNFDKLTIEQQNKISSIASRPETQASIVTPSGNFRIHFDTTGTHRVMYSLNELSDALDSAWNYEINILGYPPPPSDGTEGGDALYDVYIQELGSTYGWTDASSNSGSPSYIQIDNDFAAQYTTGIDGAKVTVAHELHHAIQIGNYIYKIEDSYYYELLSTSMEEFVFDSINDYYFYLSSYFDNPAREFYRNPGGGNVYGYDLAIWNIFLKDKYGFEVIKRGLENVVNTSALEAMANAISEFDGSFKKDLSQFGIWNYFTGSRAKEGKYYEEAENYPLIKPLVSLDFTSNYKSVMVNSNPSSNNYIRFVDKSRGLPDTLVSIITNSDYFANARHEFEYTVYNYEEEGTSMINDFYYSLLTAQNKLFFTESAIFNNELAVEGKTERREIDYSFPQPFSYNKHSTLFIPTGRDVSGKASLNVYTTSMDLVFSGEKDIFATDKIVVRWDGKTNNGEKLPTGVYIYVTKAGDNVKKGKIVIYNE